MSMISPEAFVAELEDAPYERLIEARRELVLELERLEEVFRSSGPVDWACVKPSEDVRYGMTLEYLAALANAMCPRACEITGIEDDEDDEE